jgi:hypothetical protein
LQGALTAASAFGIETIAPRPAVARQQGAGRAAGAPGDSALALARFLNNTKYGDLPPKAIEHAKMILASTFASAAPGSLMGSARIIRDLAKEHGGKAEATIWFDGARIRAMATRGSTLALSDGGRIGR